VCPTQAFLGSNTPRNLLNGLIAYYPFNGNACDESGHGNNGLVDGPVLTKGVPNSRQVYNGAFFFNGTREDQKIIVTSPRYIPVGNQNRTLCAWVYPLTQYGFWLMDIVSYGDGLTTSRRYSLQIEKDGNVGHIGIINQYQDLKYFGTVNNGTWSHVCGTYDSDSNINTIYVNGIYVISTADLYINTADGTPLMIGTDTENRNDEYYSGRIDELRVYNRCLNYTEILQLYLLNAVDSINSTYTSTSTSTHVASSAVFYKPFYCVFFCYFSFLSFLI